VTQYLAEEVRAGYNGKKGPGSSCFGKSHGMGGKKMAVQWRKDIEAALKEAKEKNLPLLIDFSAAPG
jgi:hypothetical protein